MICICMEIFTKTDIEILIFHKILITDCAINKIVYIDKTITF